MTATPDLPSGLTYYCLFSGSGAVFPPVVPAIEIEAGSQYQCNITGSVSRLNSVKQGLLAHLDFVFVIWGLSCV